MKLAITPDLAGHTNELETMYAVLVEDIGAIVRPTVIFSHTIELKITELADAETNPNKKTKTTAPRQRSAPSHPCYDHP